MVYESGCAAFSFSFLRRTSPGRAQVQMVEINRAITDNFVKYTVVPLNLYDSAFSLGLRRIIDQVPIGDLP